METKRPAIQFSLGTAIFLMIAAGFILGCNILLSSLHSFLFNLLMFDFVVMALVIKHRKLHPDYVFYTDSEFWDFVAFWLWAAIFDGLMSMLVLPFLLR